MLTHNFKKSGDSSEVLETRFPYLEYPYPGIKCIADRTGPRYIKTHLPVTLLPPSFENSNAKVRLMDITTTDLKIKPQEGKLCISHTFNLLWNL